MKGSGESLCRRTQRSKVPPSTGLITQSEMIRSISLAPTLVGLKRISRIIPVASMPSLA